MQTSFYKLRSLKIAPVIAWLVMQFLMTGIFPLSDAFASTEEPNATIEICTVNGLQLVTLDGEPVVPKTTVSQGCEWCQAFGNIAPLQPSNTLVKLRANIKKQSYQPFGDQDFSNQFFDNIAAIRAPPSLNLNL